MKMNIEGKVALVTGGGRDIGKEISKTFAEEGVFVAINYNKSSLEAENTAKEIISNGGKAKIYKADITSYEEVTIMINKIKRDLGTIDFLVNNAGYTKIQKFVESTPLDWDRQIDTSLKGAINCCHAVAADMISNKFGKIINLVGDKGISVGENSNVEIKKLISKNSNIGVASKDGSITRINNAFLENMNICFSAYNKKQEFNGGLLDINNYQCNNYSQKYDFDDQSIIKLNKKIVKNIINEL